MSEKTRQPPLPSEYHGRVYPLWVKEPSPSPSPVVEEVTFTGRITANVTDEMVEAGIEALFPFWRNCSTAWQNEWRAKVERALIAALRVR